MDLQNNENTVNSDFAPCAHWENLLGGNTHGGGRSILPGGKQCFLENNNASS